MSAALVALSLAGCAHPEDRRWISMTALPASTLSAGEMPRVQVYSFEPPKPDKAKTTIRDFSDRGQAAIVDALAAKSADPDALRKALAAPLSAPPPEGGTDDRAKLSRTLVISISKGPDSQPGDRLVRTIVTIRPTITGRDSRPDFEFSGYTVAATDNKVQSIAHLEDQTDLSLKGSLAPKIGGFGDNGIEGAVGSTRKSSADISQQYENLNVDITPRELTVTRESERGLDVVGNTLIALTVTPSAERDPLQDFIVSSQKLFDAGKPLASDKATFVLSPLRTFPRRDLTVEVSLRFVLRRIVSGREYYTEGKQKVELVYGDFPAPVTDASGNVTRPINTQVMVRSAEAQPALYMVCVAKPSHENVMASTASGLHRMILYDDLDDARAMATWLGQGSVTGIGNDGVTLELGVGLPLPKGASYYPMPLAAGCSPLATPRATPARAAMPSKRPRSLRRRPH